MTEFNFYLSDNDTERLFAIKKLQGRDNMTGNDFARELFESALYRLFPAVPEVVENGNVLNADKYKG